MKKRSLSVIVLAKNEESMIADCLDSVAFADELIVIDNLSTDDTVSLARKHGAKVITTNAESFATRREIGLSKASGSYVLYLDADERLSEELGSEIKDFLSGTKDIDAFILKRQNYYLGKNLWPKIEEFARFFKKSSLKGWRGDLHETPIYSGSEEVLAGMILHYTHRNFSSMIEKTNHWSDVEAQLRLSASHPAMHWWRFPRVMSGAFFDSYIRQQGFRAGKVGLMESIFQSFSIFITYAKLWELQSRKTARSKDTQ